MKVVITKKQYKDVAYKLLKTILGELRYENRYENDERTIQSIYIYGKSDILDDISPMTIWVPPTANKGCKRDLTLDGEFSHLLDKFIPLFRSKLFSKVLVQYVYDELGIKCDCVEYDYDFSHEPDHSDDENAFYTSKTYKYNVKKKKKLKENYLTESNLRSLFKRLDIDLTGKIKMITSQYDLPMEFDYMMTPSTVRSYLNSYGPMYGIEIDGHMFLYQNQNGRKMIVDVDDRRYHESKIMDMLGVPPMGITLDDIVDTFVKEED